MDAAEPYVPPTKIPRPKFTGKHKSKMNFQKISNTYPMIVYAYLSMSIIPVYDLSTIAPVQILPLPAS